MNNNYDVEKYIYSILFYSIIKEQQWKIYKTVQRRYSQGHHQPRSVHYQKHMCDLKKNYKKKRQNNHCAHYGK